MLIAAEREGLVKALSRSVRGYVLEILKAYITREDVEALIKSIPAGPVGPEGPTGSVGPKGEPGERGESGANGIQGEKGERGEAGPIGESGPRGEKGDTGIPGPQGERGERGETGERGPIGEVGPRGDRGEPGMPGIQGERGEKGDTGERGPIGERGEKGIDGRDGLAIEVLPVIPAGRTCSRGIWARHAGGIVRAYRDTDPIEPGADIAKAGWEVILEGQPEVEIRQEENQRSFTIAIRSTSGAVTQRTITLPVLLYREIFKDGTEYECGDAVTYGGSTWCCVAEKTKQLPAEQNKDWRLMVRRGRDGKDAEKFSEDSVRPVLEKIVIDAIRKNSHGVHALLSEILMGRR